MFVILRLTFIALMQHQKIDEGHGGVKFPCFILTTDASDRTLIRIEEGPKALAAPLQPIYKSYGERQVRKKGHKQRGGMPEEQEKEAGEAELRNR